jgi:hypothetical protein
MKKIQMILAVRAIINVEDDLNLLDAEALQDEAVYQVSLEDADEWEIEVQSATRVEE